MTLTGLRCLVGIVDADLNISAAAAVLHMSQPCVSRQLKQVEETLGFHVFARRGRSLLEVTPAGREVVEAARRIVREIDGLRRYAANARGEAGGELVIAAPQTYALHVLPPVLATLLQRYPELSVRVQPLGEGQRVCAADHDRCDLVVVSTAGTAAPDGIALPLFRWQRVVIAPHGHALAAQAGPVSMAQLARWPLVTYESSRLRESSLCRTLGRAGLVPRFSCSAHDADTLKAYVRAGLGVGLVAELSITPADSEDFVVLQADPALPECLAWAVLPRGRVLRNPTLDLLRMLAPALDEAQIRRASEGMPPERWPEPRRYLAAVTRTRQPDAVGLA